MIKKLIRDLKNIGIKSTLRKTAQYVACRLGLVTRSMLEDHIKSANDKLYQAISFHLKQHDASIYWLTEFRTPQIAPHEDILISIIMPTYNRSHFIEKAIKSVLDQTHKNWELLIIDDGSTDNTKEVLQKYRLDSRIHYFYINHIGPAAARNVGLKKAKGDIITYLDTDNTWYPHTLATFANAFVEHPEKEAAYMAQLNIDDHPSRIYVYTKYFKDWKKCEGIDMNVFAHRPTSLSFDETLKQFIDWDFIKRHADRTPLLFIPEIATRYCRGSWHRISNQENNIPSYNRFLILKKHANPIKKHLKVLYMLFQYPHLSESYVQTEISYLQRQGVHIEIWSQQKGHTAPCPATAPVHYGSLEEAIKNFSPDIIHSHWIHFTIQYFTLLQQLNIPLTIRGHGFDFNKDHIAAFQNLPHFKYLYLFPALANLVPDQHKIRPLKVNFDTTLYYPAKQKNPKLVLRTCSCLPGRDAETFIQIAKALPDFRFVLIVARATTVEEYPEQLLRYNESLGSPAEIYINMQREAVAEFMQMAGIYLLTKKQHEAPSMPISAAEAMATGCYVIASNLLHMNEYINPVGKTFNTKEEAIQLIRETQQWTEAQWKTVQQKSIDYAYGNFADEIVLPGILEDWLYLADNKIQQETIYEPI